MPSDAALNDEVRRLFREVLTIDVPADDTDLIEGAILDSLALVELLFEIERRMGISLELDDLEIENFRTVERIADVIAAARAGQPEAAS
jgi:methoxymalonate biosynthesis acyl carrier protein